MRLTARLSSSDKEGRAEGSRGSHSQAYRRSWLGRPEQLYRENAKLRRVDAVVEVRWKYERASFLNTRPVRTNN